MKRPGKFVQLLTMLIVVAAMVDDFLDPSPGHVVGSARLAAACGVAIVCWLINIHYDGDTF